MALYGISQFGSNFSQLAATLCGDDEVMGIETLSDDMIAGLCATIGSLAAPLGAKQKAFKKIAAATSSKSTGAETNNLTDKALFISMMWQLPKVVQEKIRKNELQLVPFTYYGCKEITGKNHIDVFDNGDFTIKGVTNLVQGRMPSDEYFLASKVCAFSYEIADAEAGSKTADQLIQDAEWGVPAKYITNGEWMFGQASTTYMDKSAASVFKHINNTNLADGEYILPTKKMFVPQTDLKAEFDMVGTLPESKRVFIRFEMHGVKTAKA